jgi:hypothetical protein
VPFNLIVSDEARSRLGQLADLLRSCRDVYIAMFDDGLVVPAAGSPAEFDLAMLLSGPGGGWPEGAVAMPRDLAAKLVRQQADYCVAMAELVASGEVFDPLNSLLRSVVEYGARATWLLDPEVEDDDKKDVDPEVEDDDKKDVDPEVEGEDKKDVALGHRRRCARQLLMELVSVAYLNPNPPRNSAIMDSRCCFRA